MATDKDNGRMIYTLQHLPPNGRRLEKGLALRITQGNGMAVLGCSRVDVEPSLVEMGVMVTAVAEAFHPSVIFIAEAPVRKEIARLVGETAVLEIHYIWHIYWPLAGVKLAEVVDKELPKQAALL